MAGLIERIAKTEAVLMQPNGFVFDGAQQMVALPCMVLAMKKTKQNFDENGHVQYDTMFLVAPLEKDPVLPGTITVEWVTYTMASVQTFRNMRGVLMGYCITVAAEA